MEFIPRALSPTPMVVRAQEPPRRLLGSSAGEPLDGCECSALWICWGCRAGSGAGQSSALKLTAAVSPCFISLVITYKPRPETCTPWVLWLQGKECHRPTVVTWFGLALGAVGLFLMVLGLCLAMKARQMAVPGHFLLQPRTGTRYTRHQATVIQRRLDRIRRAVIEDSEPTRLPLPNTNLLTLPGTPPPWDTELPPSYETVMNSAPDNVQHL
ncbi:hypothetical protein GN956_G14420 [Arapaima gigas]